MQTLKVATNCTHLIVWISLQCTLMTHQLMTLDVKVFLFQRTTCLAQFARQFSTKAASRVTCVLYTTEKDNTRVSCVICSLFRQANWWRTNKNTTVQNSRFHVMKVLAVWIPAVTRHPVLNLVCVLLHFHLHIAFLTFFFSYIPVQLFMGQDIRCKKSLYTVNLVSNVCVAVFWTVNPPDLVMQKDSLLLHGYHDRLLVACRETRCIACMSCIKKSKALSRWKCTTVQMEYLIL